MKRTLPLALLPLLIAPGVARGAGDDALPARAVQAADHAARQYDDAQVKLLAELVRYETVHEEGVANAENPAFRAFARHVEQSARDLGLDFIDYGAVLVVGLGDAEDRLGVVTHGDVQPADATKWRRSPFELDTESEPGRLVARGTEDDKAPIATAMYAMKAIKDLGLPMKRRIELIIGLTEESDHEPFLKVLERYPPPQLNVGIDANYPVVVAEKGWCGVWVTLAATGSDKDRGPAVESFEGGAFLSQVPEDARIVIARADADLVKRVRERARTDASGMNYRFERDGERFVIQATGRAAHSSEPEHGINALAHAAALLDGESLAKTPAGRAVDFVNALVGTGLYGKRFGDVAYSHPFMGPLTMNLATLRATEDGIELGINVRAPAGKTVEQLDADLRAAIREWSSRRDLPMPAVRSQLNEAYLPDQPAQVEPLLAVFRHYTGMRDAEPNSIGGGTFARLLPKAVNFGPSMPGAPYTGHSEHEFITREQMSLNLRMYTAMLAWLATDPSVHDAQSSEEEAAMLVQYLEIVTPDVEATCDALEELHGVTFGEPDAGLGNARTAALEGGGRIGVRAPLREDEELVVRPYVLVDDIETAVKAAEAAGGEFAVPPTEIPGHGTFAIYFLGGVQHGLWQH